MLSNTICHKQVFVTSFGTLMRNGMLQAYLSYLVINFNKIAAQESAQLQYSKSNYNTILAPFPV